MLLHISSRLVDGKCGITFSCDDSVTSESTPPPGAWTVGDPSSLLRVEDLAAVSGLEIDLSPPQQFLRAAATVAPLKSVPLKWMMPGDVYQDYLRRLRNDSWDILERGMVEYYHSYFATTRDLLRALESASINSVTLQNFMQGSISPGQRSVIASFRPDDTGFAPLVRYNQVGSRTGRLTERSGPQILRLKRDFRSIIQSRFDGGHIVQVDFVSLEARIAAALGGMVPERDIYTQLSRTVFENRYPRSAVKLACLSVIYGAGRKRLASQLSVNLEAAGDIIERISRAFDVKKVSMELLKDAVETGSISNHFGRKMLATDKSSHILYNNFIQSTGVDVAMHGFQQIVTRLKGDKIVPIFILHDAIIFDVHSNSMETLRKLANCHMQIDGFEVPFYVDVSGF